MSFFKTIHVGFLNQVVLPKEEGKGGREGKKSLLVGEDLVQSFWRLFANTYHILEYFK